MSALAVTLLLTSVVYAKVFPRQSLQALAPAARTLQIPVPSGESGFSTTISGCSIPGGNSVAPFVVAGVPTGTFIEGEITIYFPPQASPTSTTYTQKDTNATEVIIGSVLPGSCADYPFPDSTTESGSPSATPNVCPEKGCSAKLVKGAEIVIGAINQVSLLSQNLQSSAKRVGEKPGGRFPVGSITPQAEKRDEATGLDVQVAGPIEDVARGLQQILNTLTLAFPRFAFLSPLPPGCDSDTVVIALIEFVRIHQTLLNILIGRAGLLEGSPIKREAPEETGIIPSEGATNGFIGSGIALALRALERIIDTVAARIIFLIPTRGECAKQEKAKLSASLKESISAYEG